MRIMEHLNIFFKGLIPSMLMSFEFFTALQVVFGARLRLHSYMDDPVGDSRVRACTQSVSSFRIG